MPEENKKSKEEKFPASMFCQHTFFTLDSSADGALFDGKDIWFFCDRCMLTVKKKLTDESANL